ncbi:unnamed protein product [Kuraishia capsulata CBS 1993]|uniref:Zn(2)-C6 fungal-type domain-containing protein n=1 Tax=Kuraishia capsulata CBS 1993 TaxID=1382522 RepID=W6MPV8_9ASCO|nr:uncharacterized protein KUCA_T00004675001 [Kuraishia capsulata CBS 1993]CDK28691.1 unnamed protein product [Kuraishia capsulata CBS 1993]
MRDPVTLVCWAFPQRVFNNPKLPEHSSSPFSHLLSKPTTRLFAAILLLSVPIVPIKQIHLPHIPEQLPALIAMHVITLPTGQKRINQACDRCRVKKIRCDGQLPCGNCQKVHYKCAISDKLTRNSFPKGYTKNLERKIIDLENELMECQRYQRPVRLETVDSQLRFTRCTFEEFKVNLFDLDSGFSRFSSRFGYFPFTKLDTKLYKLVLMRFEDPNSIPLSKLGFLSQDFVISPDSLDEICLLLFHLVLWELPNPEILNWISQLLSFGKALIFSLDVDNDHFFIFNSLLLWFNRTHDLDMKLPRRKETAEWFEDYELALQAYNPVFGSISLQFADSAIKVDHYSSQTELRCRLDLQNVEQVKNEDSKLNKLCQDFRLKYGISEGPIATHKVRAPRTSPPPQKFTHQLTDITCKKEDDDFDLHSFGETHFDDLDIFKWNEPKDTFSLHLNTDVPSRRTTSLPSLSEDDSTLSSRSEETPSLFGRPTLSDGFKDGFKQTFKESLLETFAQSLTSNKLNSIQTVDMNDIHAQKCDDILGLGDYEDLRNLKKKVLNL